MLFANLYANSEIFNLVNDYRNGDIDKIKESLDKYLTSKEYWLDVLKNKNTDLGYYESVKYIFVATKSTQNLELIFLDSSNKNSSNAIFGENPGDKQTQGDLATPIGVYDLQNRLKNLPQYYGPLAFVTSYPNLYDKLYKKTGYGIWIHGLPLNGDRTEKNTKGCIAIENNILEKYDNMIDYKNALLITSIKPLQPISKEKLAVLLQSLFIWRDAWIKNDLSTYLSYYNNDFTRFDGININEFKQYKKRVFDKREVKTISFTNINITPYPTIENKELYRITFLEDYKSSGYKFHGVKELYATIVNNNMSIIIEK